MNLRGHERIVLHTELLSALAASAMITTEYMQRRSCSTQPWASGSAADARELCGKRLQEARDELAMFFYTSNTPPRRALNPHLHHSCALLGATVPGLRGAYLNAATEIVKDSMLQSITGKRYAIVTDGWSKRTLCAVHH